METKTLSVTLLVLVLVNLTYSAPKNIQNEIPQIGFRAPVVAQIYNFFLPLLRPVKPPGGGTTTVDGGGTTVAGGTTWATTADAGATTAA